MPKDKLHPPPPLNEPQGEETVPVEETTAETAEDEAAAED
mgnify:CR=1 FL=1